MPQTLYTRPNLNTSAEGESLWNTLLKVAQKVHISNSLSNLLIGRTLPPLDRAVDNFLGQFVYRTGLTVDFILGVGGIDTPTP